MKLQQKLWASTYSCKLNENQVFSVQCKTTVGMIEDAKISCMYSGPGLESLQLSILAFMLCHVDIIFASDPWKNSLAAMLSGKKSK